MNNAQSILAVIEPWHAELYTALARPLTLQGALTPVKRLAADCAHFEAQGDIAAVKGATRQLRNDLVMLAAVEAVDLRALTRKAKTLGDHRDAWADDALAAAMIMGAIAADVVALTPTDNDKARIDALMQGRAR